MAKKGICGSPMGKPSTKGKPTFGGKKMSAR